MTRELKLGLIGMHIGGSRAPDLHRLAGSLCDINVTYDLIELQSESPGHFDRALAGCRESGYQGVNVTYPFKERAARVVAAVARQVRQLGAINTILLDAAAQPRGFNTDYSGFKRAFAARFPARGPGIAAVIGAGGVGRAIAFGLVDLGAAEIRLFDRDMRKAASLAADLGSHPRTRVRTCESLADAIAEVDGLINATPVGMHGHPGTAIPAATMGAQKWAFDAVYVPMATRFLRDAEKAGLEILGGYELFFHQGVDAFEIFSGIQVDEARLRQALAARQPDGGESAR